MIALEALETMGILEKAFVRADKLSGGQQQRVALARALTQKPKVILADEPVASLDPITTVQVMDDFARINKDLGITIVANMHHVDLALKYAKRIIGIKAGEIVYDGPAEGITKKTLKTIYGRALKHNEVLGD
jgi:phosphonate transport system ATP-binding protein